MAVPQIDAGNCMLAVTLCLWLWTRIRLPEGCHYQESNLRHQNTVASMAFVLLLVVQAIGLASSHQLLRLIIAGTSGLVFFGFACLAYSPDGGFWAKRRNQLAGFIAIMGIAFASALFITIPSFIPVLSAFAISHLCRRRYAQIVASSIRDLEAIHQKLLKQEATFHNTRNFDNYPIQKTS